MPRVIAVILVLLVFVYGLVDVIRTDGRYVRGISKPAWIVVMVVLPVLGAILWFIFGRPYGGRAVQQVFPGHPTAPDDDPEFLRNLEIRRRNQSEAERLKKLRKELEERERKLGGESASDGDA
ncbi:PLD nuclease N-terminal domain-containing protein [Arthrobacter celericrescens]|uniref:PLD nuclease N-terminal domain-containing protein n=1 Tax=Arthrobacter celericrescens TaxID=2320851 RepID=UPI000EA0A211|nr:PLD nuclease N-terminal domain-containing protein [Arthrobacter celericrescens]